MSSIDNVNTRSRFALALFRVVTILSRMLFLRKALARGLTPANVAAWFSITALNQWEEIYGTARLRVKAALLGVELGSGCKAWGKVGLIRWPGARLRLGANVSVVSSWRRATASALAYPTRLRAFGPGAFIDIGDDCQLSGVSIAARSTTVRLGKGVLVAPNCAIVDSDFHAVWPPARRATDPAYENDAPVNVGDYAWIGMRCLILKGVTIGAGAVLAAGSVAVNDVPENCLAGGSPAKVIKKLAPEAEFERD